MTRPSYAGQPRACYATRLFAHTHEATGRLGDFQQLYAVGVPWGEPPGRFWGHLEEKEIQRKGDERRGRSEMEAV